MKLKNKTFDFFGFLLDHIIHNIPNKTDNLISGSAKITKIGYDVYLHNYRKSQEESIKKFKKTKDMFLLNILQDSCFDSIKETEKVKINDRHSLNFFKIKDIFDYAIYFDKQNDCESESEVSSSYYYRQGKNFLKISDILFTKYNNKIFIERKNEQFKTQYLYNFSIERFILTELKCPDKIFEFSKHKKANKILEKDGVFLFYGLPGAGKSSFVFSEAFKDKKVISFLAKDFVKLSNFDLDILSNILKPDVVVVEEFDKAAVELDSTLVFFDHLRNKNIKVVLTANNISVFNPAMIRPGRIDYILKFDPPNKEEIETLVNHYSQSSNKQTLSDYLVDKNFSHAYVVDFAKKLNDNFEEVKEYIDFLKTIEGNE